MRRAKKGKGGWVDTRGHYIMGKKQRDLAESDTK